MKKQCFGLCLFLVAPLVHAAYKGAEYEAWKASQNSAFSSYLSAQDKAFIGFLDAQWKDFDARRGIVRDPVPKPLRIPVAPPAPVKPKPPALKDPVAQPETPPKPQPKVVVKSPAPQPVKAPKPTPVPVIAPVAKPKSVIRPKPRLKQAVLNIDFYGNSINLPKIAKLNKAAKVKAKSRSVSAFWKYTASLNTQPLLQDLKTLVRENSYNDWASLQIVKLYSEQAFKGRPRAQTLLQWFVLANLSYNVKIGISKNDVHLYVPSKQTVFGVNYLDIDGQKYYLNILGENSNANRFSTYDGQYSGATKMLDLGRDATIMSQHQWKKRTLSFSFKGRKYTIPVEYDLNKVNFLASYPQTDFEFYFNSEPTSRTQYQLLSQLRKYTQSMSQQEAVNFLLRFAQKAFTYKTDNDGFGYENYLLQEETIHYPFSDCEDRSILFSWLVRKLIGIKVVGLLYPGHVATAVKFDQPLQSGQFNYRGEAYTVADPTYVNANAGQVMPQFVNTKPTPIAIQ